MKRFPSIWLCFPLVASAAENLTLASAVQRAITSHPTVVAAQSAARAAAEHIKEARAARLPHADYTESWTRSDNPVFVFGSLLTQHQFTAQNFALGSLNQPDFLNNFQSLVTAEQPLWDAGRTKRSIELAETGQKSAEAAIRQTQLALATRTARAYLDASLASAAIPIAEQAVKSAAADLEQAKSIRDAGRSTDADALDVQVHLSQARETLIQRRAERKMAAAALNLLVGAPLDTEFELSTPITPVAAPPPVTQPERPELDLSRLRISSAQTGAALARAAWLPQVNFRAGFEADRQRFVTRAGVNWMAGVSLRWTIFDGGAARARIRAAAESTHSAESAAKATEQQINLEVAQAGTMLEAAQARIATAQASIDAATESLRITRDRYGAGLATITDLLRTETAFTQSTLRLLVARQGVRMAQLNQAAALGKLTPDSEVLQ